MIKLYVDWNVMSQMRSGYHQELLEIISNKNKFFIIFSTSHISDIAASDQKTTNYDNIVKDLKFISKITDDYCVFNDGKNIIIDKYPACELYNNRTDLKSILSHFDFITPLENYRTDESANFFEALKPSIEVLQGLPIDDVFRKSFENPETNGLMKKFLPDLEGNYNAKNLLSSFFNMFNRLNENEDYKLHREIVQNGLKIKRDKIYASIDPYKFISDSYEKNGIKLSMPETDDKHAPLWFNKLTNDYIILDMHGFQEDKVEVKNERKKTFRNTIDDAFHAAFATTCDFYITNDKRNFKKAIAVYKENGINTHVMMPMEFVEHYKNCLHFDNSNDFINLIIGILQFCDPFISEDGNQKTYFFPFFILDFFNKMYVLLSEAGIESSIILTKEKPTNNRFTYKKELIEIVDKLLSTFGDDLDNYGRFYDEEIAMMQGVDWHGRRWLHNGVIYSLRMLNGYLQLYIELPDV